MIVVTRTRWSAIMNIVILDAHPKEDARITKHVKYLLEQGLNVYRMHYNHNDESAKPGAFSQFGEKGFRINFFIPHGKLGTIYLLVYCLRRKILTDCLKALGALTFDPGQPSVIHVHDPHLLPLAGMLVRSSLPHSKIVYDRHEVYEELIQYFGVSTPLLYEKLTKNSISAIVIVSDHHAAMTRTLFPGPYIATVPNYPMSTIYDENIIKNKIQSLNSDSRINAVYIGSLNSLLDRDVDLLIRIADAMLRSYDNVHFIVGGTYMDVQSKMKIDACSRKHDGRFQFLGYVPWEKTIELTQKAHIGFFLLRPDTRYWVKASPNKVFEYLMCGTVPVVRADVDHADALKKCSLIFGRSDDDDDIMKAVRDLLDDPQKLKEYMEKARELSVHYTWDAVAVRYIKLYNTLLYPENISKSSCGETPAVLRGAEVR